MGKKSGPTVQPVDPVATSKAQSAANIETAREQQRLNMVNTRGPDGSVTYAADPNAPGGYSQTTTLSPGQQQIYDASTAAQAGALGVANDQLGRVATALGQPLNTSGLPSLVGGVGAWGQPTNTYPASSPSPMGGKAAGGGQTMPPGGGARPGALPDLSVNYGGPSRSGPPAGLGVDVYAHPASAGGGMSPQGGKSAGGQQMPPGVSDTFSRGQAPQGSSAPYQGGAQGVPNVPAAFQPSTLAQLAVPSTGGIRSSFDQGGALQTSLSPGASLQYGGGQGQPLQYGAESGALQSTFDRGASLQYGYDPGQQVQGQVGGDLNGALQTAQNAAYQQATSRLNPQWDQSEAKLDAKLAAQGLSMKSDAARTARADFGRDKNDAYNQATYSAIGAGENAAQNLFGRQLGQGQFANAAAAQQYAQNQGQAAFHNATAGQDYSQNLGAAQFNNQAVGQGFQQNVTNAQLHNAAAGQAFQQGVTGAQLHNAAAGQDFQQQLQGGQFRNAAVGQGYTQNMGAAQFGNDAQQQLYGQQLSNMQSLASLQNQGFNQYQTAQNQGFNQGLANAQLSNTARQQGLTEQAYLQNQPINQFTALLGSGQVQMPTGINYSPTQVAPTDVLGAYALNQQGQIANAQIAAQRAGGLMGGLSSLGGAAIMAGKMGSFSDRRLKTDILRLGERLDGIPVYLFRYTGEPEMHVGVMAQEVADVRPEAVFEDPDSGFLMVDYSQLEAA